MLPDTYDDVPRNLTGTRFLIRKRLPVVGWTLRLTWVDLGVVMMPSLVIWNVLSFMGIEEAPMPLVRLPYEPFGLFGLMLVPAVVISIMHRLYPHTDVARACAGLAAPRQFSARPHKADKSWRPGAARSVFAEEIYSSREGAHTWKS